MVSHRVCYTVDQDREHPHWSGTDYVIRLTRTESIAIGQPHIMKHDWTWQRAFSLVSHRISNTVDQDKEHSHWSATDYVTRLTRTESSLIGQTKSKRTVPTGRNLSDHKVWEVVMFLNATIIIINVYDLRFSSGRRLLYLSGEPIPYALELQIIWLESFVISARRQPSG
jgi:hypothetical protein